MRNTPAATHAAETPVVRLAAFAVLSALCFGVQASTAKAQMGAPGSPLPMIPGERGPIAAKYAPAADRILKAALTDTQGYDSLTFLCDRIGKRLSGTPQLGSAVAWTASLMRQSGLQNVRVQPVAVPHWVRGNESASITTPVVRPLHMLGLGMSVGTPHGGITAPVIFVHDFAQLDTLPASQISGRIVVFNPGWKGYGVGALYRTSGPSRAAAKGAVAVLVRSATGLALQLPHTGTLVYDNKQPKIPSAAISVEDALLIERLTKDSKVQVHLQMDAHMEADVQSGNVMGEIVGSEKPEEVVVLGGHLDSWDVGQGAQDDGTGIMATYAAVSLLKSLNLHPRRTIRLVFWVNEENGGAGGRAYRQFVGDKIANHVAAIEMDGGAETPLGMAYGQPDAGETLSHTDATPPPVGSTLSPAEQSSVAVLRDIVSLLAPIRADTVSVGGGGSDIAPIVDAGVPALSPRTTEAHYFDWHHTEADTLDKVDLDDFRRNIGMLAVVTYVIADMDGRLAAAHIGPR